MAETSEQLKELIDAFGQQAHNTKSQQVQKVERIIEHVAEVLNWADLVEEAAFQRLDLLQTVTRDDGVSIETTCTPMTFDGIRPKGRLAAPRVGEHSNAIRKEFGL